MTFDSTAVRLRGLAARLAAEFGIVVLGVTVALWADGRVVERQRRETEAARLVALRDNISSTLDDVREERENAAGAERALRLLASHDDEEASVEEIHAALLYGLLYVPAFRPELAVYEDLKSSGELSLLTDPALRRALAAMDAEIERLDAAQADMATVQQLNLDAYLISRLDLRSILGEELGLAPEAPTGADLSFVGSLEFTNLVVFKLDLVIQVRMAFDEVEALLAEVESAIAR